MGNLPYRKIGVGAFTNDKTLLKFGIRVIHAVGLQACFAESLLPKESMAAGLTVMTNDRVTMPIFRETGSSLTMPRLRAKGPKRMVFIRGTPFTSRYREGNAVQQ